MVEQAGRQPFRTEMISDPLQETISVHHKISHQTQHSLSDKFDIFIFSCGIQFSQSPVPVSGDLKLYVESELWKVFICSIVAVHWWRKSWGEICWWFSMEAKMVKNENGRDRTFTFHPKTSGHFWRQLKER